MNQNILNALRVDNTTPTTPAVKIKFTASIAGKPYELSCTEAERHNVEAAVEMVDARMNRVKASGKMNSAEKIAVMVALNFAAELVKQDEAHEIPVHQFSHTISNLAERLDAALKQ